MTKTTKEDVKINAPQGYRFVTRTSYGNEEVSSDPLTVPNFEGPTATVTVSAHYTKNLGNYESARIGVEISLPCYPVDEDIVRTSDHINELASAILQEQIASIK